MVIKDMREHLRSRITETEVCVLCQSDLDADEQDRGIVEFMDGWFWICAKCRLVVGEMLDATQCKGYDWDIPPYRRRSRKYWLKYLEVECGIRF